MDQNRIDKHSQSALLILLGLLSVLFLMASFVIWRFIDTQPDQSTHSVEKPKPQHNAILSKTDTIIGSQATHPTSTEPSAKNLGPDEIHEITNSIQPDIFEAIRAYASSADESAQPTRPISLTGESLLFLSHNEDFYFLVKADTFEYLPTEGDGKRHKKNSENNPLIINAINQAEAFIQNKARRKDHGILVFTIKTQDQKPFQATTQLRRLGSESYRPGSLSNDKYGYFTGQNGKTFELRVQANRYHEFNRQLIFNKDKVTVWEDIVLEPVTPQTASTITGTLWLEGRTNLVGIPVMAQNVSTITDHQGRFTLTGLGSGHVQVTARADAYHGLYAKVPLGKRDQASLELRGYRLREFTVKWAFQSNGTKQFSGPDLQTGTAILADGQLDRVSFAKGFTQVNGKSDFMIYQREASVILKNFDVKANGPGFYISQTPFEEIVSVPENINFRAYSGNDRYLKAGQTYVFRTFDGKHYAKLLVMEETQP